MGEVMTVAELETQLRDLDSTDPRLDWRTYAWEPLSAWLATVRARGYRIMIEDGAAFLAPGSSHGCHPVLKDYWQLKRHQHALLTALAGTHPAWWSYASGQSDVPPANDDIPTVPDPVSADGLAYACAWCGGSATTIDDRAVAFCDEHRP